MIQERVAAMFSDSEKCNFQPPDTGIDDETSKLSNESKHSEISAKGANSLEYIFEETNEFSNDGSEETVESFLKFDRGRTEVLCSEKLCTKKRVMGSVVVIAVGVFVSVMLVCQSRNVDRQLEPNLDKRFPRALNQHIETIEENYHSRHPTYSRPERVYKQRNLRRRGAFSHQHMNSDSSRTDLYRQREFHRRKNEENNNLLRNSHFQETILEDYSRLQYRTPQTNRRKEVRRNGYHNYGSGDGVYQRRENNSRGYQRTRTELEEPDTIIRDFNRTLPESAPARRNKNEKCHENTRLRTLVGQSDIVLTGKLEWMSPGMSKRANVLGAGVTGGLRVISIIKGQRKLDGKLLVVSGFGKDDFCNSKMRTNDIRIVFTTLDAERKLMLSASLFRVNLRNLMDLTSRASGEYIFS